MSLRYPEDARSLLHVLAEEPGAKLTTCTNPPYALKDALFLERPGQPCLSWSPRGGFMVGPKEEAVSLLEYRDNVTYRFVTVLERGGEES